MPVSRRALLRMLLIAPGALATACFDDEKLGDVQEPTSQSFFSMRYKGGVESAVGGSDIDVTISFVAPDTWEVQGDGSRNFPQHVILSGARGWQQVRSVWTDYPDADFLRTTLLSFAPALAAMDSDARSNGKGPRYQGEASRIYRRTISSEDEMVARTVRDSELPPDAIATITTTYADLVTKLELHAGVDSKLVYYIRNTREGPHIKSDVTYAFDYETPVSITVPS